jgi:hypothetical protein
VGAAASDLGYLIVDPSRRYWWDGSTWRRLSGVIGGAEWVVRTPIDPLRHLLPDARSARDLAKQLTAAGVAVVAVRLRYLCPS